MCDMSIMFQKSYLKHCRKKSVIQNWLFKKTKKEIDKLLSRSQIRDKMREYQLTKRRHLKRHTRFIGLNGIKGC